MREDDDDVNKKNILGVDSCKINQEACWIHWEEWRWRIVCLFLSCGFNYLRREDRNMRSTHLATWGKLHSLHLRWDGGSSDFIIAAFITHWKTTWVAGILTKQHYCLDPLNWLHYQHSFQGLCRSVWIWDKQQQWGYQPFVQTFVQTFALECWNRNPPAKQGRFVSQSLLDDYQQFCWIAAPSLLFIVWASYYGK